jgi:sugar-specific transcriptional regulator TrmB
VVSLENNDSGLRSSYHDGMQRVVRKLQGFAESDEADRAYYRSLSPQERLNILLQLIAHYQDSLDETAKRFKRVCRVTKLQRG